jgi:hypothetical protein
LTCCDASTPCRRILKVIASLHTTASLSATLWPHNLAGMKTHKHTRQDRWRAPIKAEDESAEPLFIGDNASSLQKASRPFGIAPGTTSMRLLERIVSSSHSLLECCLEADVVESLVWAWHVGAAMGSAGGRFCCSESREWGSGSEHKPP